MSERIEITVPGKPADGERYMGETELADYFDRLRLLGSDGTGTPLIRGGWRGKVRSVVTTITIPAPVKPPPDDWQQILDDAHRKLPPPDTTPLPAIGAGPDTPDGDTAPQRPVVQPMRRDLPPGR